MHHPNAPARTPAARLKLGRRTISCASPCYLIAEVGHNHGGRLDRALRLVEAAAAAGAHMVKFQKRDNRTLYTRAFYQQPYDHEHSYGATYGEHREALELDRDAFAAIKAHAEQHGLDFTATAFDERSADFLEDLGVTSYKIASGDLTNLPLLRYVARLGKPMFVSTGASTLDEIRAAHDAIAEHHQQFVLLHCVSSYPADDEHLNLRFIHTLKREFPGVLIGLSSHDRGTIAPLAACAMGAAVIEKHFTLDRTWKGSDHDLSLEPDDFRGLSDELRRLSVMLGSGERRVEPHEAAARKKMGKGIYAARPIRAGTRLSDDDIAFKSPAAALTPAAAGMLLGGTVLVDIEEEQPLTFELVGLDGSSTLDPARTFSCPADPSTIRLLVLDFDGVLTDNRVRVTAGGNESVLCWRGDGIGLSTARAAGLEVLVLSGEPHAVVRKRCDKLGVRSIHGCADKLTVLREQAVRLGVRLDEVAYMGNDVNDLECMTAVGLPACPADAHSSVVRIARYVSPFGGGRGAVRDFCDQLVQARRGRPPASHELA